MATHGIGKWYVEIEKQGFWRGNPHTWVNRYVMSGATNPTVTDAQSVINGLKGIENRVMPAVAAGAGIGFVQGRAYGLSGGEPLTVVNYNLDLNPSTADGFEGPATEYSSLTFFGALENCLEVRTKQTALSSTGKPVYTRKYFRGIISQAIDTGAPIASADLTQIDGYCLPWNSGVGGTSYTVTTPAGRIPAEAPTAQNQIVAHQVPRGRKRSSASASASAAFSQGVVTGANLAGASTDAPGNISGGPATDIFGEPIGLWPPRL